MTDRPITDLNELSKRNAALFIRPILIANMEENERLYRKIDSIEKLNKKQELTVHSVIQDVVILLLGLGMLALHGCA
jgi:hypothetical protein